MDRLTSTYGARLQSRLHREEPMQTMRRVLTAAIILCPAVAFAQAPKAATYITDEEIKTVNRQPGIDRTIRVVDIGNEHFAIGIIHRAASGGGGAAGRASTPTTPACGVQPAVAPVDAAAGAMAGGITHDA